MKILYRISDKGNEKPKLEVATKENCLRNAISQFGVKNMIVFADNCEEKTEDMVRSFGLEPKRTSLGNSASLRHIMKYAIDNFKDDDIVYLLEDDYLHLEGAAQCIREGLEIADYVTLYDHPDKYLDKREGGNPFIRNGGEKTKLLLTPSTHWKETNSTTMTYACRVKTLKEDFHVWERHSKKKTPKSFHAYQYLIGVGNIFNKLFGKNRVLISSVPARSTHAELAYLSPLVDWSKV